MILKYPYLPEHNGLAFYEPTIEEQLAVIANRYIGANAPLSYTKRLVHSTGFKQDETGRYVLDLAEKLGAGTDGYAFVAGMINSERACEILLSMTCLAPVTLYINGCKVYHSKFYDEFNNRPPVAVPVTLNAGINSILLVCRRSVAGFGALLGLPETTVLRPFADSEGMAGWVWSELFACVTAKMPERISEHMSARAHESETGLRWYPDCSENTITRRFYEGPFSDCDWVGTGGSSFGRWDYPIGVTLQGLNRTGRVLEKSYITDYVSSHVSLCVEGYSEAMSDAERYGYPGFCHRLVSKESLDDFGAMCAAMLDSYGNTNESNVIEIANACRAVVINDLGYLRNGAYYRVPSDTLWADDLYMGTSFLKHLYDVFGDAAAMDIAAQQFISYRELLWIDGIDVLSHVYDVKRKIPTGIPWGRGNGWALFSLAELLESLPQTHPQYFLLLEMFQTFSAGVLRLQGKRGYWHQVLTDTESYEETSCTAMFTYAFSKGARLGWYADTMKYRLAAEKGWHAISTGSIDKHGNVYAVCKGSGYSFTKEYYADELGWVINDNHGIGIVLLAGCELGACTR